MLHKSLVYHLTSAHYQPFSKEFLNFPFQLLIQEQSLDELSSLIFLLSSQVLYHLKLMVNPLAESITDLLVSLNCSAVIYNTLTTNLISHLAQNETQLSGK